MKKRYMYLLLVILFIPMVVGASSKDVTAKYEYTKNINYSSYEFKENILEINIDNYTLKVKTEENKDVKLIVIKPEKEAKEWIKKNTNNENNYYLYFEKDKKKITIEYSLELVNNTRGEVIKVYNTEGKLLQSASNYIKLSQGDIYFTIVDQDVNEEGDTNYLEVDTSGLGKVMIEGKTYESNSLIEVKKNDLLKVAIIPDYGYKIKEIIYNDEEVTDKIKNGFIDIKIDENNLLKVELEKIENKEKLYNISGVITKEGKTLEGATVIIGNNNLIDITDKEGYYNFENVYGQEQYIIVMVDDKIVGYTTFILNDGGKKVNSYQADNYFIIETLNETEDINIDINIDDDYSIELVNIYEITKKSNNYIWIVLSVLVVLSLGVFFYKRRGINNK